MCCHNGTHVDAPFHFINGGKTINEVELEKYIGYCMVIDGDKLKYNNFDIRSLMNGINKLLIKGDIEINVSLAHQLAESGIELIGVEKCTVGNKETGEQIHKIFLEKEIVILEGIRLSKVEEGKYFLSAQPINIAGIDGAPCRAILIN
jgi:arylformamidase